MPLGLTDDPSTLVQVMAWCQQVTSLYLSQCWPDSMSSYGTTRPQWVNTRTWTKWHFADIIRCIIFNKNSRISDQITGKYVLDGFIDNKSTLVQIMTWCQSGNKSLTESMLPKFQVSYESFHIQISKRSCMPHRNNHSGRFILYWQQQTYGKSLAANYWIPGDGTGRRAPARC